MSVSKEREVERFIAEREEEVGSGGSGRAQIEKVKSPTFLNLSAHFLLGLLMNPSKGLTTCRAPDMDEFVE